MIKSEARRRGGLVNYSRYGHEGMVARGKKGGRPRLPKLEEIRQHQSPKAQNNKKEVTDSLVATNSLTELKRLWKNCRQVEAKYIK